MAEERIGRYRILEEIASGTQGTVYRGFDAETGRLVAVKILHASLTGDATYLERFHREATLAASIDHQNVVRIYEVGEDAGRHFMALEFLPENLARLIQSGGLPPERAASLTAEIADGLAAAHACGIVHRDVKPQNILVTPEGTPKVTDFGIARGESLSTMTSTGMMMGTPYYMSPEQALGERADARSDVYSLGCVLYQMLTGEVPFQASTPLAVLRQHTDVQPRPVRQLRSDVPRGLADIVQRSMEKAPARRYANAGEMASALRSAMPGLAPAAATPAASRVPRGMAPPPPPPWEPAEFAAPPPARPRRGGGRRFAYVFGGLCLIGAIAAAAVLVVGSISTQVSAPLPRPTPMPVPVARELTATPAPRLLETPVPRPLVESSPSVYFEDTFDGGVLKPEWRLGLIPGAAPGDGWQLEWDEDAYQLVGRGNAFAAIGDHAWIDFKLETRIRLDRGSGHVNLMADDRGYSVRLPELDLMMAELGPGIDPSAYEVLAKSDGPYLQYGRWYDLTVVVIANRLEVYVDGEPAFAYAGPQPMPKTRIDFESHLDSVLRVRSAMILGVQDHLPAPAPAGEAPRPLLFRDTFDGGVLQPGWQIQPAPGAVPWARWDLTWDEGAYQLVGEEHAHALIGGDSWTDYRVEAQVRLDRGSGRLNFRLGQQGRYNVTLPEVVLGVDRPAPDGNDWGYRRLAESARPRMEYGRWYEIWVVASGNRIEVYVDGEMAIGYADPDPLWAGAVEFESFADSVLRVQWVTVLGGTDLFPAPGPTREAPSGVLFEDTFDGGVLQPAWRLQPADDAAPGDRWEMVWEEGEPQLIGRGHALAAIGDETWTDYRIDARVRLDEGNGHLNFRTGLDRRYTVRLPEVSLYADKHASERNTHWTGQLAANIGPAMEHGRWADLSVTVSGNRIEVYVDGGLAVSYVDPDPIPSGGVDFESLSRSTLRVAEVQVVTDDGFGAPPSSDAEPGVALRDDFEGGAGHVWSDGRVSHSGPFTQFLGRFGNDTVSVKLTDLPAHNLVRLMFDLYVIDSWDGNDPGGDPDYFQVGFGSSTDNLLSETFTRFCPNPDQMSYAATQPEVCGTDLGFDPASQDVIYRNLNNGFTFEHSGGELVLNFTGRNLEGIDNESWGIDNVRVFVGARVHEPRTFVDEPGAFVVAGSDLGPFTIVRFESRPDGTPLHDREQLDGSEFAERGVWFEAPEFPAYGLQICGPAAWQESNSLSPGRCPQDAGEDDDDGLIVRFDPPVVAAQLRLIDNDDGGQGESVAFLDTSGAVIGWIGHLPGSWAGMVSPGTPIAEIRIVESQEGDDVTYDDVLFVQAAAGNVSPSAGAEGRFTPNGHYYKVVRVEEGIRWGQAMERARNMSLESVQGYLATITSPEENEWVRRLVSDAGVGNTWLGGVQAVPNAGPASDWHWITGERWEYTNWAGGEPNDSGQDEIYLVFAEADAWNDAAPGSSPAFVVEFPLEPVTETAPAYDLHANVVASYDGP
ncbi:MAG: protein kinase, partial [Chloroflexi bacterium]|nr:protein kinase [Chloroflexota bacterium]